MRRKRGDEHLWYYGYTKSRRRRSAALPSPTVLGQQHVTTDAPLDAPARLWPTMAEVRAVPLNGLRVVSTFSGCGGSCLGFRQAGFQTVWASEFVPAAADTYRANHPDVYLDTRDVREVTAQEVLDAAGLRAGEADVMEGSPPCASFSTSGKRARHWGKEKAYSDTKQRTDDLFFEFVRLLEGVQPKAFVAENVKGLVMGVGRGYFKLIHRAMTAAGYRVACRVLDAQYFGVPQRRERAIFVGVRDDLGVEPSHPRPQTRPVPLREVLPGLLQSRHMGPDHQVAWRDGGQPSGTIFAVVHDTSGNRSQGDVTDRVCPAITVGVGGLNSRHFQVFEGDISRYAIGAEWDKLKPGEQSKRFFSLVKADPGKPCPTVSAAGGPYPSGACVVHPFQKRKFTMDELRVICGFPPDFILTGTYGQQWERLGRAVPPPMMKAVAEHVRDHVLARVA